MAKLELNVVTSVLSKTNQEIIVDDECLGDEYIPSFKETETHILVHWVLPI